MEEVTMEGLESPSIVTTNVIEPTFAFSTQAKSAFAAPISTGFGQASSVFATRTPAPTSSAFVSSTQSAFVPSASAFTVSPSATVSAFALPAAKASVFAAAPILSNATLQTASTSITAPSAFVQKAAALPRKGATVNDSPVNDAIEAQTPQPNTAAFRGKRNRPTSPDEATQPPVRFGGRQRVPNDDTIGPPPTVRAPAPRSTTNPSNSVSHVSPLTSMFALFLDCVLSNGDGKAEQAALILERMFFEANWSDTPVKDLEVMLQRCTMVGASSAELGHYCESWAHVFFFGCHVRMLERRVLNDGAAANLSSSNSAGGSGEDSSSPPQPLWQQLLYTALHRSNLIADALKKMVVSYQRLDDYDLPLSCVTIAMLRIRQTFEIGASVNFFEVTSHEQQLLVTIARSTKLNVYEKVFSRKNDAVWARFQAAFIGEQCALRNRPPQQFLENFLIHFDTNFHDDIATRATLLLRTAQCSLATGEASFEVLRDVRSMLGKALALLSSPSSEHSDDSSVSAHMLHNRRVVARFFAAVSLALGFLPPDDWLEEHQLSATFSGMAHALRTANYAVYENELQKHLVSFVELGIAPLMHMVGAPVRTTIVIAYFISMRRATRLDIKGLQAFASSRSGPQNSVCSGEVKAFTKSWLMPLLMEKFINGAIDSASLVLSGKNPFEHYPDITADM